jgi:hypothetical protein
VTYPNAGSACPVSRVGGRAGRHYARPPVGPLAGRSKCSRSASIRHRSRFTPPYENPPRAGPTGCLRAGTLPGQGHLPTRFGLRADVTAGLIFPRQFDPGAHAGLKQERDVSIASLLLPPKRASPLKISMPSWANQTPDLS